MLLADSAIAGFTVNRARLAEALDRNPILVTALNPVIGYEKGAAIAKKAYAEGKPIREVAAAMTGLPREQLDGCSIRPSSPAVASRVAARRRGLTPPTSERSTPAHAGVPAAAARLARAAARACYASPIRYRALSARLASPRCPSCGATAGALPETMRPPRCWCRSSTGRARRCC